MRLTRVQPYTMLAPHYDATLGIPYFRHLRRAFESVARRHQLRFRCAADVGCGTGLFACYLARCWRIPVFAVDRSPAMLRIAARRCCGLPVRFLLQDMRCLSLPCPVDLITSNFDTVNHLLLPGDVLRAFLRFAANLRPGGMLVFDFITNCQPLGGRTLLRRCFPRRGGRVIQRMVWDPRRRMLSSVVIHHWSSGCPPAVELHPERLYAPQQISDWLSRAGFIVRAVYDAATLRPADRCAPRLLVIAQKSRKERDHVYRNE